MQDCGNKIVEEAVVCVHCVISVEDSKPAPSRVGIVLGIFALIGGFFAPILGWIFGGIGLSVAIKTNEGASKLSNILGLVVATGIFIYNLFTM